MPWIYRYIRADMEEIDMGPYAAQEEADEARREHASCGAIVSEKPIEVSDGYKLWKGNVMNIKVEIESETAISDRPARMLVYEDDRLIAEVIAKIELKQGADGGYYNCVILEKKRG